MYLWLCILSLISLIIGCGSGLCPLNARCGSYGGSFFSPVGVLDTSFNGTGIALKDFFNMYDEAYDVAMLNDGKFYVAGAAMDAGFSRDFAVVKYNANGSVDTSFGAGGLMIPMVAGDDMANAIAIQSDGKIVLVGEYVAGVSYFAIGRLNTDGSLDTSFNTTGKVLNAYAVNSYAYGVAVQLDGKIVAVGQAYNGSNYDIVTTRFNSDGSLDTTYNLTGKTSLTVGVGNDYGRGIVIQPDNKIVIAGFGNTGGTTDIVVARYNNDGSLDTTFNSVGYVTTAAIPGTENSSSLVLQTDGKILVSGITGSSGAVYRFLSNGTLDLTYNGLGYNTFTANSYMMTNKITLQSDGKAIVAGYSNTGVHDISAVVRLNTNGTLDNTFNGTGMKIQALTSASSYLRSVAMQPNGKILAVGIGYDGVSYNFLSARYE